MVAEAALPSLLVALKNIRSALRVLRDDQESPRRWRIQSDLGVRLYESLSVWIWGDRVVDNGRQRGSEVEGRLELKLGERDLQTKFTLFGWNRVITSILRCTFPKLTAFALTVPRPN